jgi:hypothetical protein
MVLDQLCAIKIAIRNYWPINNFLFLGSSSFKLKIEKKIFPTQGERSDVE